MSPRPGGIDIKFEYGKPKENKVSDNAFQSNVTFGETPDEVKIPTTHKYHPDHPDTERPFKTELSEAKMATNANGDDVERLDVRTAFMMLSEKQEMTKQLVERLLLRLDPVLMPAYDFDIDTTRPPVTNQMTGAVYSAVIEAHVANSVLETILNRIDL